MEGEAAALRLSPVFAAEAVARARLEEVCAARDVALQAETEAYAGRGELVAFCCQTPWEPVSELEPLPEPEVVSEPFEICSNRSPRVRAVRAVHQIRALGPVSADLAAEQMAALRRGMGDTLYNQYLEAIGGTEAEEATHRAAVAAEAAEADDALWQQAALERGSDPSVGSVDGWLREYGRPRAIPAQADGLFRGQVGVDTTNVR